MSKTTCIGLMIFLVCNVAVRPARAHSYIKNITVVHQSEKTSSGGEVKKALQLSFSAPIEVKFSKFELVRGNSQKPPKDRSVKAQGTGGAAYPLRVLTTAARESHLRLELPASFKGDGLLRWNILSSDGHRQRGVRKIRIENGASSH